MIPIYVFVVLLLAGNAVSLEFNPCEGGQPPNSMHVFRCREQPCEFTIGNNVTGFVNLTAGEESADLDAEMTVDLNGSLISFPVPGVNICDGTEDGCRIKSGASANFYYMFQVNFDLPEEEVASFKLVVKNEKGTLLSCSEFKGKIVRKKEEVEQDA